MKVCLELPAGERLDFPVKLEQRGRDSFRVTYGLQVKDHLDYASAELELGLCLMHSLACAGHLDNRGKNET